MRLLKLLCLLLFCCILPVRAADLFANYQAALSFSDNYYLPLIDGNLDEPLWLTIPGTQDFVAMLPGGEAAQQWAISVHWRAGLGLAC